MRVKAPDGKVIEFPDSMSTDQVGEAMRKQYPPTAPKAETTKPAAPALNPRPFGLPAIPDPFEVAGAANRQLAKPLQALFRKAGEMDVKAGNRTPEQAEKRAMEYGQLGTDLAEGVAVPWTKAAGVPGAVGRVLQSGLLGAAQTGKLVKGGLAGLVGGIAGEGVAQIPRFWQMAKVARSQAADKAAFDKAMTETLNKADRVQYDKMVSEAEAATAKAADSIVADFKAKVPAWSGLKGGVEGLQDMVVGQGQELLSKKFDTVMKQVIDSGAGTKIVLPRADVEALGMKTKEFVDGPAGPLTLAVVDAGQAAASAVGKWSKEPGAYRRIVSALDKAGIGDAAARQEYKAGQALINFVDKSGALKGGTFNPEAAINGMNRVKTVDELRRRGMGDVFRGPMQAARGVPKAPLKPPVPREVPPEAITEGIKRVKNPLGGHPWLGGLAGEAIGHMAGAPTGLPFAMGALASQTMPKEIVTQARLTPEQLAELARIAGVSGTGVRSGINNLLFPPTR